MPLTRVSDFGKLALNTDVESTLLQPGEWSILDNIDIESGDIRSAWGDSMVSAAPPIEPRYIFVFEGANDTWLIGSDGTSVYAFNGESYVDITPSEGQTTTYQWDDGQLEAQLGVSTWDAVAGSVRWDDLADAGGAPVVFSGVVTYSVFLGTLIVSSSAGVPTYWPGETGRLQPLPGWPSSWRAQEIVPYENFLVAIGFDDGTIEGAKYRVAWSDAAAEGELPQTWQPAPENLAGSVQLRDSEGFLVTAVPFKNRLAVYKNDSIYFMSLSGDEFVMSFERIVSDHGCDSRRGVAAIGDAHFFADRGDIRVFNGQTTQSVAVLKIKEALTSAISNEFRDETIVVAYPEREQVWVGVVPAGATVVERVLIFDLVHNAWSLKRYDNVVDMVLGPFSVTSQATGTSWDSAVGTWDQQEDTWNESAFEPSEDGIIFSSANAIWRADKTHTDQNMQPKTCIAERTGFVLADLEQNVTLKAVYPEMEGSAPVQISIGAQWQANGDIRWTPEQTFRPGVDRKLNVRITGAPCGFRIRSQVAAGWRLGALSFLATPASRR